MVMNMLLLVKYVGKNDTWHVAGKNDTWKVAYYSGFVLSKIIIEWIS